MTLSRWLRDYLYIPLGGNRKGRLLTYRNLMLTMLLGGLWHGAAWTFVVWGGIHGLGLALERLPRSARGRDPAAAGSRWLGRIAHLPRRLLRVDLLPRRLVRPRRRVIARLFTAWGQPSPLVTTSVVLAILVGIGGQYVRPRRASRRPRGFRPPPAAGAGGRRRRRA